MPTSIRLEKDVEARLDRLAHQTGHSKAYFLRKLIETGLQDMEDYHEAMAVLARVRQGEEPTLSAEELRRELGLDD